MLHTDFIHVYRQYVVKLEKEVRLIQGGSGGRSVFWEVISDCENNIYMDMYVILNGYRGRTV